MAPLAPDAGTHGGAAATRVASAVVLAIPVILAVQVGTPYLDALVAIAVVLMAREWCRLCTRGLGPLPLRVLAMGVVAALAVRHIGADWSLLLLGVTTVFVYVATGGNRWLAAGVAYLGLPSLAFVWLRQDPSLGRETIFWLLAVVWGSDIGAYLVGRAIGGPKLAPRLSPNKTWAGSLGGVAIAAAAGTVVAAVLGVAAGWTIVLASGMLATVSQIGDLFESWVKRRFGAKDAGGLIPGHGGVLDRVDALLAATLGLAGATVATGGNVLEQL